MQRLSILCHLFYPSVANVLLQRLKLFNKYKTEFYFNIQGNSEDHILLHEQIRRDFKNAKILTCTNKGRDIGAKLMLIGLMLELETNSQYTLIIHDKKSPHLDNADFWREKLYVVTNPKSVDKILKTFENDNEVGLIGSVDYVQNEYDSASRMFLTNCRLKLKELIKRYDIKTNNFDFIAGNIFWIRTDLIKSFFKTRSVTDIRADLESGNVLDFNQGTYVHSWERIMSWIASSNGYKVYGV